MRAPMYSFPDDSALAGRTVVVLGLGLYHGGAAVCRFLHRLGCRVIVTDLRDAATLEPSLREIEDLPVERVLGGHRTSDLDRAAFVVVNPAVPADAPFLVEAVTRGIPLVSEVGLFLARWNALPAARLALITGSKGKTTTSSLLHAMVKRQVPEAELGGNIGRPLLERVHAMPAAPTAIFEISSFQLEQIRGLQRRVELAVVTNVFPVHIDRHGTFLNYKAAKQEVLVGARAAIRNVDDSECRSLHLDPGTAAIGFGVHTANANDYRLVGDSLVAADGEVLLSRAELRIPGLHNVSNVLAAFAAADRLGVPRDLSRAAAREFAGVEHRLELVFERDGVRYVNDSIATTPQSAVAALDALEGGIVLIAGGKESPFELDALARRIVEKARSLLAIGESGHRIVAAVTALSPRFDARVVGDLESAVSAARDRVQPGDVILLSPAFPSFDQFKNFKERGELFGELARSR